MSKPTLFVLIGLPASGKSTYRKEWMAEDPCGRVYVNYDEARSARYGPDWVWNRKEEEEMKAAVRGTVTYALRAGLSVCIDNTNLSSRVRAGWQDLARDLGAEYLEHEIDTQVDECIRRDRLRKGRVGQAVIDGMALEFGMLDWDEHGRHCHERRTCTGADKVPIAIVDIDSTLADDNGRLRHLEPAIVHKMACTFRAKHFDGHAEVISTPCPQCGMKPVKDWASYFAAVAEDLPIQPMINLLDRLSDHLIVLISGRPVSNGATPVGILTEDWLLRHRIRFDRLFLKTRNFHQPSPDFKREILEHLPKERVAYVFDDDPRCVEMYRKQGIYVLQPDHKGR